MFKRCSHHVGAGRVLRDRAHHIKHNGRSRLGRINATTLCVKQTAKVSLACRLNILKIASNGVNTFYVVWNRVQLSHAFKHRFQSESTSGIIKIQTLLPGMVMIHLMESKFDLKPRSEEHTSELQSLMRISYAVFCLQ